MANDYNITFSEFVETSEKAMISDIKVFIKELMTAGDSSSDTATVYPLGYMEDEKPLKIKREYVTMERGVPRQTIRKDLVKQTISLEGTLNQIQKEHLALALGLRIDGSTGTAWDRILIGSEIPPVVYVSLILEGKLVDDTNVAVFLRKVQFTSEDVELMFGSTDKHTGVKISCECLKDEHPLSNNPDWDFSGSVSLTCGTTTSDATVTIASTSSVYVGMRVVGAGIPAGAYIESIVTDTSFELSEAATATGAAVTLHGENMFATYAKYEDIGYLAIERAA